MSLALLFTIALAVVLLVGAIIISKSKLPSNEKIVALVVIMALFTLVAIVNEVKRATVNKPASNIPRTVDFQKGFFSKPISSHDVSYRIPQVEDFTDFVTESLGNTEHNNLTNYALVFLYTDRKAETSLAFKEYTRSLQASQTPALYIELDHPEYNVVDFSNVLRIPSVQSIDETVRKLNQAGQIPSIFVDNAHNALTYDETLGNGFVCSICKYLLSLYDTHKANIVLISDNAQSREYLKADPVYNGKVSFLDVPAVSSDQIESYLLGRINSQISKDTNKFTSENINTWLHQLGWSLEHVDEYLNNINNYESVDDFVHRKLDAQAARVAGFSDFWDLLAPMLTVSEKSHDNAWVSYAQIKRWYEGNPTKKLEDAINAHILVKDRNQYRFSNITLYNALKLAKSRK